ncbi:MAG: cytochrome ubiquinol oxidase subunit I, partial [Pseudomonadota bacterium]
RIMVGIGVLMLLVSWFAAFQIWRRGDITKPVAYVLVGMAFSGWVATLAGWYVTEIGRQPYLVSGVLTTSEAVSSVAAPQVAITLVGYLITYALLLIAFIATLFYLARKAVYGDIEPKLPELAGGRASLGQVVGTGGREAVVQDRAPDV